jgi:hypothetical protein
MLLNLGLIVASFDARADDFSREVAKTRRLDVGDAILRDLRGFA